MILRNWIWASLIIIYLLILAGGLVRATGSGMGCPDWPRCFGMWIPPTHVEQLPLNYQEVFGEKLKGEVIFNATKTWTEYLNRLLGALSGLVVLVTCFIALFSKAKVPVRVSLVVSVLLMGFQGWLGSKVVSSELHPVMVTAHMFVAILIVFLLSFSLWFIQNKNLISVNKATYFVISFALVASLIQIYLGTQVREAVDNAQKILGDDNRGEWLSYAAEKFFVHRSYAWVVVFLNVYIVYQLRRHKTVIYIASLIVVELLLGMVLAYFKMNAAAQPFHLTIGLLLVGFQFYLLLNASLSKS